ncbi:MAG: hypothetical protein KAU62_02840, partial [Candidatus Heimdallarchaeota archaeon]|nr:hypothetical protein [Candidatus Heimdallarchaeota archaeon]MCK4610073.1 hypothetical protein [Candidatus Heimdallarchaeota archaeon]
MKNKKKKLFMSLSILIMFFLVSSSSLNNPSSKALLEKEQNQYKLDSFDRSTWKWNTTEVVSTELIWNSAYPSIAVDTFENVHVAWIDWTDYAGSGTDSDIFYRCWNATTNSWEPIVVVSTESSDTSLKTSIAADSAGNVHIAWEDITDYDSCGTDRDIFYKRWEASNASWTTTEVLSTESTNQSREPSLAVDTLGNIHIVWDDETDIAGAGNFNTDIFYKRWNASSTIWTTTEVVSAESVSNSWKPSLDTDSKGNVHVAWHEYTNYAGSGYDNDIFYKYWNSSSTSWIITEVASTESTGDSYFSSLAVDSLGNVQLTWQDSTNLAGAGTDRDIFYKYRDFLTSSWTTTEIVSTESANDSSHPSIVIDSAGDVHIAWHDDTNLEGSGVDRDVFYKNWTSLSSIGTYNEIISKESTEHSEYPSLAVDSVGIVHIVWHDVTNYTSAGTDRDIFYKLFAGPPMVPYLSTILPNPTNSTTISLYWNDVPGASSYYIYRSTANILSVEGLTPIGNTVTSSFVDILPTEGTFYYVIVATNFAGNSTLSNCWSVVYALPVVYEFGAISGLMFATFAFLIVILRTRKKKLKWT